MRVLPELPRHSGAPGSVAHSAHAPQRLFDRGVKQFKFVDRTFNLNLQTSRALLEFLLDRYRPGHFFHFEMIPDRLPEALRDVISKFPAGSLQFEVGVQSFNAEVCRLISRRQDLAKLEQNFAYLRAQTGVHIHADLIVGLPGESLESFGAGFDRLVGLKAQEIQWASSNGSGALRSFDTIRMGNALSRASSL